MKNKGSAKLGLEGGYRFEGGGAPCGVVIDLLGQEFGRALARTRLGVVKNELLSFLIDGSDRLLHPDLKSLGLLELADGAESPCIRFFGYFGRLNRVGGQHFCEEI